MADWIVNKGRKRAPFPKGTLIDVKYRGREHKLGVECGGAYANDWTVEGVEGDILEYRLNEGGEDAPVD